MGKQKRERRKPHKKNPTGLPSVKDFEAVEAENATNEDFESIMQEAYEEIQSYGLKEKLSGLHTIESMACNAAHAVRLAKNGIVQLIGPLLVDREVVLRASSASTLRSIADNGKVEAQEILLKNDIMTPLCMLLKQYYTDWQPNLNQNEKKNQFHEKEALIQAVTLLWTLCEHNESAVKYSNQEDITSILIKFFNVSAYGLEISTVVVQCLLSLSEENSAAINKLKSHEDSLIQLLNMETNDSNFSEIVGLQAAVCGLLMNLFDSKENSVSIVCKVINVLSEILSVDCTQLISTLTSILPYEKNAFSSSAKKKVQLIRRTLGTQQQALEILANVCLGDNGIETDSDLNDSDCESDGMEDICTDDKVYKTISALPMEIVEAFNSCDIVKKVWMKTKAVDMDTVEILEQNVEGRAILKQIHTLNCRAYICLNNLMSSLEINVLGGMENIYRMWLEIGTKVFENISENDIDLLESATAAMRAAIQRLSETKVNIFKQLTLADIQPMLNGERQCSNTNVRVNLIRIVGNLSLILMNNDMPAAQDLIKHISMFLLEKSMTEPQVWVIAETLDMVMDIYAEDDTDYLASEIKLLEKLHTLLPVFKNKMKQQRKILGENIAVVTTVNANIRRFIRYKERRLNNS